MGVAAPAPKLVRAEVVASWPLARGSLVLSQAPTHTRQLRVPGMTALVRAERAVSFTESR